MATFHFDLVSPEKLAFSGEVDQVDVPGVEGDFGVLAGHAPVVAAIRPGILTITAGGTHEKVIVLGGLAEMSEKGLTVLADVATSIVDLDRSQFADTIAEMEAKLAEKEGSELDRVIEPPRRGSRRSMRRRERTRRSHSGPAACSSFPSPWKRLRRPCGVRSSRVEGLPARPA